MYGHGFLWRIVEHQKFKECAQRENYVLNSFNILSPILILLLLFDYDESWGAGNTNIIKDRPKHFGGTKWVQQTWEVQRFK